MLQLQTFRSSCGIHFCIYLRFIKRIKENVGFVKLRSNSTPNYINIERPRVRKFSQLYGDESQKYRKIRTSISCIRFLIISTTSYKCLSTLEIIKNCKFHIFLVKFII